MAQPLRMHPDLVRAPGDGPAHDNASVRLRVVRESLEQRAAVFALRVHNVQAALPVDGQNRLAAVDRFGRELTDHAAHVCLVHKTRIEVIPELCGGLLGRGAHHDPGREPVEAVARKHLVEAGLLLDHFHERVPVVAPRGMHGDTSRLDDHQTTLLIVAVQDAHWRIGHGGLVTVHLVAA